MTLVKKADVLAKRFNLAKYPNDFRQSFNIAPEQFTPVIVQDEDGKWNMELMKWGIPRWIGKGEDKKLKAMFNTRDDKAFSWFWKDQTLNRRCLVPADGYYEWTKPPKGSKDPKRKFYYHPKQMDLFAFAGIWDSWKDVEGKEFRTFSILTTEPNKESAPVHNRMPVILYPEEESLWGEPSHKEPEELMPFLHPYEDNGLIVDEVDNSLNGYKENSERLIKPLNSQ